MLKRLQRRHIRSLCGRIRGRSLAQRAHKLAIEQRRLRAQRLKLFGVAAENTCDSRRHLIAGRRDDPVVDGAAAPVAALIASPISVKSPDASAKASGAAITYDDIGDFPSGGATTSGR